MKEKIENLINKLNIGLIERDEQIKIALLALLSGENLILIGPPGTGKSQMTRRLANVIKESSYFEYLMTKFTTPEELFGPISIKELEQDRFHRNTESYLTDSHVVFLDEIFKSNSAILNSLLTIMNEKLYHNGYTKERVKTESILAASNELPDEENELEAIYDRFLFRSFIDYIKNTEALFNIDNREPIITENEKISFEEINNLKEKTFHIKFTQDIVNKILKIKNTINSELNEVISDRRLVKTVNILKFSVLLSDRKDLNDFDLLLLNYIFWSKGDNINEVKSIIKNVILDIESLDTGELVYLYHRWEKHFNSFFYEQKLNEENKSLYFDLNKNMTTNNKGPIHIKDNTGQYLFYKGYRDYVKVTNELGKFDHGYIDSGIRTLDKKIVWTYEFSPIEVKAEYKQELEGFEKLTVDGNLEPVMINSFDEYYDIYNKSKEEHKEIFKEIFKNLEYELSKLNKLQDQLLIKKKYLEEQNSNIIWIPKNDIEEIYATINEKAKEGNDLLAKYNKLIKNIEKAIYG